MHDVDTLYYAIPIVFQLFLHIEAPWAVLGVCTKSTIPPFETARDSSIMIYENNVKLTAGAQGKKQQDKQPIYCPKPPRYYLLEPRHSQLLLNNPEFSRELINIQGARPAADIMHINYMYRAMIAFLTLSLSTPHTSKLILLTRTWHSTCATPSSHLCCCRLLDPETRDSAVA
jgi:hypothetical protein